MKDVYLLNAPQYYLVCFERPASPTITTNHPRIKINKNQQNKIKKKIKKTKIKKTKLKNQKLKKSKIKKTKIQN